MISSEAYPDIIADDKRISRFRQAIRFSTISTQPEADVDVDEFHEPASAKELHKLAEFIERQFRTLHTSDLVEREVVNQYSLLYTLRGSDSTLRPYLLAAHLDVVPVIAEKWDNPPFAAELVNGEIHGRGTLDMKATLFGILEAIDYLLSKGFRPKRSIYLAFGHDEEIGGYQGARKIAEILRNKDVQLEFVLDEGTMIVKGVIPGLDPQQKIAMISVAEKGFATVELRVAMSGGHSSVPAKQSAIGVLAGAVARLESKPQPSMFGRGPEVAMLQHASSKMSFLHRFVVANLWLFGFLIKWLLARKPVSDSIQRTTTAITMFHAGVKSNVIAQDAVATINHRLHPSQTLEQVLQHDRQVIADSRVELTVKQTMDGGKVSPYTDNSFGFQTIRKAVSKVFPDAIAAPCLLMANTDSRYYRDFSLGVYKFMPIVGTSKLAELIHGNNERIEVQNYQEFLNFYKNVFLFADKSNLTD